MDPTPREDQAREYVQALRGFYVHVAIYLTANVVLFLLDLFTPGGPWFMWPLFGWGVAVAINGVAVLTSGRFFGPDWENRKLAKLREHEAAAGHR
jgi:hypothetical protein